MIVFLKKVYVSTFGLCSLFAFFMLFLLSSFFLNEVDLITSLINKEFPVLLFIKIFPELFFSYLKQFNLVNSFGFFSFLFFLSLYSSLFIYIFLKEKVIPLKSLPTALGSFFGFIFGIGCFACGTTAIFILASGVGVASTLPFVFLLENTRLFFIIANILVLLSIYFLLYSIRDFILYSKKR